MEKEISEDSYCTTDEGENNEEDKGYESDTEIEIDDYPGKREKIKEENIFKEIIKVGEGKEKPSDIDTVIITTRCYVQITNEGENKTIEIPELCFKEQEFSLDDEEIEQENSNEIKNDKKENSHVQHNHLPKALKLSIQTMRKNEKSRIYVKPMYIFKHYDKIKKKILEKNSNVSQNESNLSTNYSFSEMMYKEEFRIKYKNEKIIFEVELHNFYICQNLMDRGEIRKKILINGNVWKYAKITDIVYFDLSCVYNGKKLYEKKNILAELDVESNNMVSETKLMCNGGLTLFTPNPPLHEIERRVLQNVKIGELAEVIVKPSYMRDKNPSFLKEYGLDNKSNTIFLCQVYHIETFDYVFKPDKDKFTKKKIIQKGYGRDSPDRESIVKCRMLIKVEGKVMFNNFDNENFDPSQFEEYLKWREKINSKYNISQVDDDENYERDSKIFNEFESDFNTGQKIATVDLRLYSIPIVMRKVLIHMKRNELCYIRTHQLDYFNYDNVELKNLLLIPNNPNSKIEIFIHLYEFLHRPLFSKLTFQEKLKDLSEMKNIANSFFKEGKFFRACKIYQNINYRFNFGDVFTSSRGNSLEANGEIELKNKNPELYKQLIEIRLNCHNNLASAKYKLGRFTSVYEVTNKILTEFDGNNLKALYLHGKSCINLKLYDEAIKKFKKLNDLSPKNDDFINSLKEAEELYRNEIQKQKSIYKKMIFSN